MTSSNRPSKRRSQCYYNSLELRQLLAGDLSLSLTSGVYLLDDVSQETMAREYLSNYVDTQALEKGNSHLELVEIKRGLATTVTRFQQTLHGIPVVDAYVTTIQGPKGEFDLVHDQSFDGKVFSGDSKDFLDFTSTERIAMEFAEAKTTFAPSRGELAFLPGEKGTASQVWQMTVFGVTPKTHGDFLTFIDAESGKVLSQENRISQATGTGDIFYPNPYQTLGSGLGLADNDDANSPELSNQLVGVTLEGLDEGTGLLTGEFVDLANLNSSDLPDVDANELSRVYEYTRDDARFEQVVIYHTVDQLNRYFHTLGFDDDTGVANGIRDFPTLANAHWFADDQSFYSTGNNAIHFGDGGVDDGEDGDIIAHEYGHAVQHDQNASWGGGEMGAMGEGFGDYLAASFFQDIGDSTFQASHAAAVGEWDATSYSSDTPPNLRRVDGTKMYPGDLVGQVHADGEIWSRALWDMNQALGAAVADQLVLESHFTLPASSTMVTAAEMILLADQNLNGGANEAAIRTAFEDRGILDPPPTIGTVKFDKSVYSVGEVITISVIDANAPATIPVTIVSSNGDSETLSLTGIGGDYSGTVTSIAGTPNSSDGLLQGEIGDTFVVTYEDTDDGNGNAITATDDAAFANVTQYVANDVPISITDNNTIQSIITVADVGDLADIDLQLNITHTYDGDITGVLTAPNGEQITLFARIGGSGDNYNDTLFDDDAGQSITAGTPPYAGEFQPTESFAALDGISITGDWILSITDSAAGDTGTLNAWSMFIVANPKPPVGTLTIDKEFYEVNDVIEITVGDGNGPATIPVTITSSNGDSETITLTGNEGLYVGTLPSVAGSPTADDGQLQAAVGDTFTASYLDTDDGNGGTLTATDDGSFVQVNEYTAGGLPIAITDNESISSTITITDTDTLLDVDLQLNITHTWDGDLTGVLTAPNGAQITLFARIGGSGDNYEDTRFDDEASQSITDGSAPFAGVFSPTDPFSVLDGISITGDWVLTITDSAGGDEGTLNAWSLFITVEANPPVGPVTDSDSSTDEVAENASTGTPVGITAVATDPGDTVTYELTNDSSGLFAIDVTSGIVTVNGALDFETAASHTIDVKATSSDGSSSSETFSIVINNVDDAVISTRQIFYNGSSFDGAGDFDAVATDKQHFVLGETATFANYTSYWRGLNGLVLEVNDFNEVPTLSNWTDFFDFKVGNDNSTGDWNAAPAPIDVTYLPNVDASGTDRVFLTWADNAIEKEWLQTTVLAGSVTGLPAADMFYFGNVIAESGNSTDDAIVDIIDIAFARENQSGLSDADIENNYDFDRSGKVTIIDIAIARENQSGLSIVNLITPNSSSGKSGGLGTSGGRGSFVLDPSTDMGKSIADSDSQSRKFSLIGQLSNVGDSSLQLAGSQLGNDDIKSGLLEGEMNDKASSAQNKANVDLDTTFEKFEFSTISK